MAPILVVLALGALALVASMAIPALDVWGPLFTMWTVLGVLVAWLVRDEASEARHKTSYERAA